MKLERENKYLAVLLMVRKLIVIAGIASLPIVAHAETCSVTVPKSGDIATAPTHIGKDQWYGSSELAALIPADGKWRGEGPEKKYRRKLWWWREGFDANTEKLPALDVSAIKLGDPQTIVPASRGASENDENWNTMFVLMRFPGPGCWKITGAYQNQSISFVVNVGE